MNNAEVLIKFKGDTKGVEEATNKTQSSINGLTKSITLGNLAARGISKGLEIMNSHLSDAVSRIDTMNNFSTVMSNLGIATKDSEEVIKSLSEELVGLPTTLNSAASSVQRLTSYNGDIKKSEKYFLAMNNAIIAGTNDAGMQATAMEQLTQAYTKGKPDMQDWKALLQAMPAQLKQVANAMGFVKTDQLYEALKNGQVSMEDFMETMSQLNEEGINGLASFEKQARDNTAGIGTSITNMKTAFTRGVADMIKSIDEALEPFGGLAGVFNNIGKIVEKTFKLMGTAIKNVSKVLQVFGKWIKKNEAWLKPLIISIGTFVATALTIFKVINIIKKIKTAITGLITTLKVLWAVMAANPIILVIAAVAALVAGFVYLWNNCEGFRDFWIGLWKGIKTVVETYIKIIREIFEKIVSFIWNNVLKPIINLYTTAFKTIYNVVSTAIDSVISVFRTIYDFVWNKVLNPIINAFSSAFSTVKNTVSDIFDDIKRTIENIMDGIVEVIKIPINILIDGINLMIDGLNKIRIPKWVPGVGGKGLHFDKIPKLAIGTNYVPEDMLAIIHKGEAIVPKKYNPYAGGINEATYNSMQTISLSPTINVYVDAKTDPLGQTVSNIKTFSGGAKNDFNYGVGV